MSFDSRRRLYSHLCIRLFWGHHQESSSEPDLVRKPGICSVKPNSDLISSSSRIPIEDLGHDDSRAPTFIPCFLAAAIVRRMMTGSPACPPHATLATSIRGIRSSSEGPQRQCPNASPQSMLISIRSSFDMIAGIPGWIHELRRE